MLKTYAIPVNIKNKVLLLITDTNSVSDGIMHFLTWIQTDSFLVATRGNGSKPHDQSNSILCKLGLDACKGRCLHFQTLAYLVRSGSSPPLGKISRSVTFCPNMVP